MARFSNDGVTHQSIAIFNDGGEARIVPVADGKDVHDQQKKDVKKQKKDARKRAKQAAKAAEAEKDLTLDELELD